METNWARFQLDLEGKKHDCLHVSHIVENLQGVGFPFQDCCQQATWKMWPHLA